MPNIIIEDTEGNLHNYTVSGNCTARDLYQSALGVTGLGQPLNGCDGFTADAIRLIFGGREIPNNSNVVSGLQERSKILVVYNERGGMASTELQGLKQKINFRICAFCDSRAMNSTMYSKQQCQSRKCRRWVCFFCNREWNDSTMTNQQYTCGLKDCDYLMKLNFELIPMGGDHSDVFIPNTRFCPNCFHYGGYGNQCKYHTCSKCHHEFCYFCLKSKPDCESAHRGVSCYQQCVFPPTRQSYSDMPRI